MDPWEVWMDGWARRGRKRVAKLTSRLDVLGHLNDINTEYKRGQ